MSKWTDLGFECVDEGRPVYINNGNAYTTIERDGKEQLQSLSNLSTKKKDELMLTPEKIEEFEKWAEDVYKAGKKASIKQNRMEKKDKSILKTDDNVLSNHATYLRNERLAKELGFEESQNGLFMKKVMIKNEPQVLYLDFRNAIKGSFYSYSVNDDGEKYSNEQLKKMGQEDVLKYIAARDEEQTAIVPQSDVVVETPRAPADFKPTLEALKERNVINREVGAISIQKRGGYYKVHGKKEPDAWTVQEAANEKRISTKIMEHHQDEKSCSVVVRALLPNGQFCEASGYHDFKVICDLRLIQSLEKHPEFFGGIDEWGAPIVSKGGAKFIMKEMLDLRYKGLRDLESKIMRRAQLKLLNRDWRDAEELSLEKIGYNSG